MMLPMTCQQMDALLTDLLARNSDDAGAVALDEHLKGCASCRVRAQAACRVDRALGEMAWSARGGELVEKIQAALTKEPIPETQPTMTSSVPVARAWRRRSWWGAAMAACVLLAVGVYLGNRRPNVPPVEGPADAPALARVEASEGEVYLISDQAKVRITSGQTLSSRQGLQTVGEESFALVVYTDGTRLQIGADTTVSEFRAAGDGPKDSTGSGKRVFLGEGNLNAEVTKQPVGQPMVLTTTNAQVVAGQTKFSLINIPHATRVELEEGAIECTRTSDGKSIEMKAGTYSVVGAAKEEVTARQSAPHVSAPRASLPEDSGRVLGLAISKLGPRLATGGYYGQVKLWDLSPQPILTPTTLHRHQKGQVRAVAISSDGKLLATGGEDRLVRLWDLEKNRELPPLEQALGWIATLAFSPDGTKLIGGAAHGEENSKIRVWDLQTGKLIGKWPGHAGGVWSVAFSPDGKRLASAGRDGVIKIWNFATGEVHHTLKGHAGEVLTVAFSPDGETLASGGRDCIVRLWDVTSGECKQMLFGHGNDVRSVQFSPDGETLASGSVYGVIRLWDVPSGQERATLGRQNTNVWSLAFTPDGRSIVVGGGGKAVRIWDLPQFDR